MAATTPPPSSARIRRPPAVHASTRTPRDRSGGLTGPARPAPAGAAVRPKARRSGANSSPFSNGQNSGVPTNTTRAASGPLASRCSTGNTAGSSVSAWDTTKTTRPWASRRRATAAASRDSSSSSRAAPASSAPSWINRRRRVMGAFSGLPTQIGSTPSAAIAATAACRPSLRCHGSAATIEAQRGNLSPAGPTTACDAPAPMPPSAMPLVPVAFARPGRVALSGAELRAVSMIGLAAADNA